MYSAVVKPEHIYDGDTLEKVRVLIYPLDNVDANIQAQSTGPTFLWPDIFLTDKGIEAEFSLRLAGIDTPEMHPHKADKHGIVRSKESIDKEKALAQKAKEALINYLRKYDFKIYITDPEDGKYAGRIVCRAFVKDENGKLRSVSNYMLMNNFARPYFGGTKSQWT